MIEALTILHIAIAAAWFGHKLLLPGDIRASAGARTDGGAPFLGRLRRAERLGIATGLGTLISGAALWWAVGLDAVGPGVWIGASLVVAAILIGATLGRPASQQLRKAIETGDRVEATVAGRSVNRVLGIESLLWISALTAMVL
ncbi:MAG: hypothetical protein PVJ28_09040 [Acidimicrobiia bacterium]|jgi:hypothetical protein